MRLRKDVQLGFTIVEMLIVTAITTILVAFAAPSFDGLIKGSALTGTTNQLFMGLQLARSEAVKSGSPVVVCPTDAPYAAEPDCNNAASWNDGWIAFVDDNKDASRASGETLLKATEAMKFGFTVTADTAVSDYVLFDSLGSTRSTSNAYVSGELKLSYGDEERVISISSNGRMRVQ
ncbi:GspH/FimT family pseudopilin [Granulosicoccaceae sp. 1_MG-2023]|nr:GspH/FimT family pseudopilin [Granulosicoccaceae sp. 1_MG-2023]